MYAWLKGWVLVALQAPDGPPPPPPGHGADTLVFRAAPGFFRYQVARFVLVTVPGLAISLLFFGQWVAAYDRTLRIDVGFIWGCVFAVFAVSVLVRFLLLRLDYDLRYYVVTDRSLRIRHGAWQVEEATFTFANIQNLSIHQGPLERMFGVANLHVETAGGGALPAAKQGQSRHAGVIAGIADAAAVRDRIMVLLARFRDAGLGDEPSREHGHGGGVVGVAVSAPRAGLSAEGIARLREVRDEMRMLEAVVNRG